MTTTAPAPATDLAPPVAAHRRSRVPQAVRESLPVWLGSRLAVLLVAFTGVRLVTRSAAGDSQSVLESWYHWDVALFIKVAQYGWFAPEYTDRTAVDFPGMPLALRLVHLVARDWVLSGLLVSLVAGAVACACLWQLAADEDGPAAGRTAVVALVVMPYAVFLFAGYSEALFLGFSTAAWLAGRRDRWLLASLLACGATGTRVTGIPFAAGLAVLYLVQRRQATVAAGPVWSPAGLRALLDRRAPLLALPALPVVLFVVHLHSLSGSWTAYSDAMREGWGRGFATPWAGWATTWASAFGSPQSTDYQWFYRAELLAAVVGVVLTVLLVRSRRWAEAVYVGGNTLLMTATTNYASGVRGVLVWFPLYLFVARATYRHPRVQQALVWTSAPVMAAIVIGFVTGGWID